MPYIRVLKSSNSHVTKFTVCYTRPTIGTIYVDTDVDEEFKVFYKPNTKLGSLLSNDKQGKPARDYITKFLRNALKLPNHNVSFLAY